MTTGKLTHSLDLDLFRVSLQPYAISRPQALKLDLAACVVIAAGNDYLPPVRGLQPAKSGLERLWACYLALRATKRYDDRC